MNTQETLLQIKLYNFTQQSKFVEMITHLESLENINFVVCPNFDAVLIEFSMQDMWTVYSYTWQDYINNNVIIALGRDCEATRELNDWEKEQLEMKRWTL